MTAFKDMNQDQIRAEMDRLYAADAAYPLTLPWDADRKTRIHRTVLALATRNGMRSPGLTLDVGCGQIGIAAYWPTPVVGVEISAEAVARARKAAASCHEFVCFAIEDFEDPRRFATVVAVESIEHWSDARRGLDCIRNHIHPSGLFVLTTPNADSLHHRIGRKLNMKTPMCSDHHVQEFGYEELKELLRRHGFHVQASRGVVLAPYWALESVFGNGIRKLTDNDADVIRWLGEAGEHVPHLAFIQAHACVPV